MTFALDIGTRTVIGVVTEETEHGIKILDFEMVEHEERAMLDGQINDVPKVVRAVSRVKETLESRMKTKFSRVSTAVAGRFLKTVVGEASKKIPPSKIDEDFVKALEFDALADAVEKNGQSRRDYCVGYSILEYKVDDERVRSLIGQFGDRAYVSIIAAFLPQRVVEALFSVMSGTGLSLEYLTLEPMAAMHLVVPQDLRRLNIALVDVGAGTSDIAISKNGTIVAYGMIPMAGDEITEKICDKYLLSFQDGEKMKRSILDGKIPQVENILGMPIETSLDELMEIVNPTIDSITDEIAKAIFDLNGSTPAAVVIVGGGAKIPTFTNLLANKLSLPESRVALRGVENISYVENTTNKINGSEFVTPVGIAYSARHNMSKIFKRVTVNSRTVQLMNLTGHEDIFQALMQAGFNIKEILGNPSAGITYELNGRVMVVPGNMPEPHVSINGAKASLHSRLNDGDVIEISPSDGKPIVLRVRDVVKPVNFFMNGEEMEVFPPVKLNLHPASLEDIVSDGDSIECSEYLDVDEVIKVLGRSCSVTINDEEHEISNFEIVDTTGKTVKSVKRDQMLKLRVRTVSIGKLLKQLGIGVISLEVNSKEIKIQPPFVVEINGSRVSSEEKINCGDKINVEFGSLKTLDVFEFLKFSPDGLKIMLNGKSSNLEEILKDGDKLEVVL